MVVTMVSSAIKRNSTGSTDAMVFPSLISLFIAK